MGEKLKCDVCSCHNGSCNRYLLSTAVELAICPKCLAFSGSELAKLARKAHEEKRLIVEKGARK